VAENHSAQDNGDVIRAYLDRLAAREAAALETKGLEKFGRLKAQELYWTVSRLLRTLRVKLFPSSVARGGPPKWARVASQAVPDVFTKRPRLLFDMTSALRSGKNTGIQRVVREIARHGWEMGLCIPVAIHEGALHLYYSNPGVAETIAIEAGDMFIMLDASWNHLDEYPPIIEEVKAKGGATILCLHDILPILYPAAFSPPIAQRFQEWMPKVVLTSDGVIANSRATAESLRDYLVASGQGKEGFPIGWWRLGDDFSGSGTGEASAQAQRIAHGRPYFLSVGTIEPRKGHPIVLDAMEKLWAEGLDAAYVIVGGKGWGMRHFERRLSRHPEFGKRLFWLANAGDADLALLYRHARALALASVAEGFGLPIVEAARSGTPVIATDIPVFREAAGETATYFPLLDSDALAARMREALIARPHPTTVAPMSWRDSAAQLLTMARDGSYQMRLG
jgi:alpha-1,2-rhamnosyltransferase